METNLELRLPNGVMIVVTGDEMECFDIDDESLGEPPSELRSVILTMLDRIQQEESALMDITKELDWGDNNE